MMATGVTRSPTSVHSSEGTAGAAAVHGSQQGLGGKETLAEVVDHRSAARVVAEAITDGPRVLGCRRTAERETQGAGSGWLNFGDAVGLGTVRIYQSGTSKVISYGDSNWHCDDHDFVSMGMQRCIRPPCTCA